MSRRFMPGKETQYLRYRRPGWIQGRSRRVRKILPPPAFDPWTVQPVAGGYTEYAISAYVIQYEGWSESKK